MTMDGVAPALKGANARPHGTGDPRRDTRVPWRPHPAASCALVHPCAPRNYDRSERRRANSAGSVGNACQTRTSSAARPTARAVRWGHSENGLHLRHLGVWRTQLGRELGECRGEQDVPVAVGGDEDTAGVLASARGHQGRAHALARKVAEGLVLLDDALELAAHGYTSSIPEFSMLKGDCSLSPAPRTPTRRTGFEGRSTVPESRASG